MVHVRKQVHGGAPFERADQVHILMNGFFPLPKNMQIGFVFLGIAAQPQEPVLFSVVDDGHLAAVEILLLSEELFYLGVLFGLRVENAGVLSRHRPKKAPLVFEMPGRLQVVKTAVARA